MTKKHEDRIQRLEETIAHQNAAIEELSDGLTKQWQDIDVLEKKVAALIERFLALEDASEGSIENTKPPHY